MLQISSGLKALIEGSSAVPFVLIKISFATTPKYITDAPRNITYEGNIYSADGGLKSVSPPKADSQVSRDLFNIVISDPDNSLRTQLDYENIGIPVRVMSGFVNPTTNELYSEFLGIYAGKISRVSWTIDEDSPDINIECSGPFSKLKQIINRTTSAESQRSLHSNDSSLDLVYDSTNEATVKWGGKV